MVFRVLRAQRFVRSTVGKTQGRLAGAEQELLSQSP